MTWGQVLLIEVVPVLVEIILLWRLRDVLRRGVVTIRFGASSTWNSIFKVNARRATFPALYWLFMALIGLFALLLALLIVVVAGAGFA